MGDDDVGAGVEVDELVGYGMQRCLLDWVIAMVLGREVEGGGWEQVRRQVVVIQILLHWVTLAPSALHLPVVSLVPLALHLPVVSLVPLAHFQQGLALLP